VARSVLGASVLRAPVLGTSVLGVSALRSPVAGASVVGAPVLGERLAAASGAASGAEVAARGTPRAERVALALLTLSVAGCLAGCGAAPSRSARAPVPAVSRAPGDPSVVGSVGPGGATATATAGTAAGERPHAALTASARSAHPSVAASRGPTAGEDPPLPSGLPSSAPLRVRLAAECVVPGGEQRLVVETAPNAFVAFDNLYPDQRTGRVHGGADGQGRSDTRGRFTAAWRVTPDTPVGRVRVDVGVSARSGSAVTMTYYRLATAC
jgi:hypothetical protein